MMKRGIVSVLAAIFLVISTVSVSFAAETVISKDLNAADNSYSAKLNLKIDKTEVKPGDNIEISMGVENVLNADKTKFIIGVFDIYDTTKNEKEPFVNVLNSCEVSSTTDGLTVTNAVANAGKVMFQNKTSADINISDFVVKLNLKIKDNIESKVINLSPGITVNSTNLTDKIYFGTVQISITDTPTPDPTPTEATYTVSTKPSADSVYAGDEFNVDVVASADQATDLASLEAILQYDKELVKPVKAKAKAINTDYTPLFYTDGSNGVTTDGTGKIYIYGNSEQTGTGGLVVATYEFEALKPGNASFSIAKGARVGRTGKPDADITAISGATSTVEIKEKPDEKCLISNADYKGAPDGKQVLKYVAKDMPADGNAYFYGEDASPLYYAYDDSEGKHVFLGFVDAALTNDTLAAVTDKTGKYEILSYTGDINRNNSINAVDSLIAYDLATGVYSVDSDMSILTAQRRLEADINKDGKVTAADARAIMFKALGIDDPELAQ